MTRYLSFKPVVEFVRHDAEISIDLFGKKFQKVIQLKCASNDEAEKLAEYFCANIEAQIIVLIEKQVERLKTAQP